MSRAKWRYKALETNSQIVDYFCDKYQFAKEEINGRYQMRIEGVLDVYPVSQRWHWLPTGARGQWNNAGDLRRIFLENLPEDV